MTLYRPETLAATLDALSLEFADRIVAHDRAGTVPAENFARLHEFGLTSLTVPAEHGGGGANLATTAQVARAIAYVDPSTTLILLMQYFFQRFVVSNPNWPPHLRDRVYRDAVEKGALLNALRVEPELGTPARGGLPATIARRTPEGWSISGHKLYSTGIPVLSWLGVWGRTDETDPRVGFFLVPRHAPGIRVIESWDHLGMRSSGSHEVVFENVLIPEDHAVDIKPAAAAEIRSDAVQAAWMAVLVGALYDSTARAGRDWLARFANERVPSNLGAPLSSLPRFQEALGRIEVLLHTNRVLIDQAIAATDRGEPPSPLDSNLLKYTVTNNAIEAVEQALRLAGNHGLSRQNPLERHYRDVLCSRIHTPQNDTILVTAGKQAFARHRERRAEAA